jgi:3-oxoacyl-(acyl-carrier-protein) synthase
MKRIGQEAFEIFRNLILWCIASPRVVLHVSRTSISAIRKSISWSTGIRGGEADIVVCGGAEACIDRVSFGAFAAARTMSTGFNDRPIQASRPFDVGRDDFVMGEGTGMPVIEDLEHALRRGATPIAELLRYGTSADAYHITSPSNDGAGGRRAMELAIRQANVEPERVGHFNAHATSTRVGDASELAAIKAIFGTGAVWPYLPLSPGQDICSAAAGGVEATFTVLALRDQFAPPRFRTWRRLRKPLIPSAANTSRRSTPALGMLTRTPHQGTQDDMWSVSLLYLHSVNSTLIVS